MILLTNNAEKAIAMLVKNYGEFDMIIEQLMEEVRQQKEVNEQNDVISKIEIENEARPTE
jgi:3-methyladenine DNA glycosylase Tag